ncbi:P-loop NTPase fold protein [Solwaraspora sp. WMMD1047]|uniref:P-loop NTPase fold protein n=1 Tax=Solwaraspora sp. WMMD1047 TaxID=3016102 RepID=UPI002416FD36|nr:P-loop NTPase fold protein [Solwaraspora sp. WMMD1047]MDG4833044.1 P-loop NTPase fold protein [Solwaraspora sp. WMMD1047]
MEFSLIPDQAIGEADTRNDDGLGFDTYSRILASAATNTRGPFTIGVFGEWGTGKTSLMRLIERRLDDDPNVVTVWFNAWRYEQEEHPIIPLVGTIVRALEQHKGFSATFGVAGKRLVRSLRAIAYGFSAKSKVKVPGFAEVEASFVAKDMIERDERLTPDPLLDRSLYFGAFNSLDKTKLKDTLRVVVLIDDLDRCFPDQAIRLLESIKLVLAQPGFIFVLGVARKVIEGYLQHRYTNDYGIADFKGELYLDKIVQLPFHIPPSRGRMGDFCKLLLADQPAAVAVELDPVLPVVAQALGGNPRALIRFVNNILIDYAISQDLAGFAEQGGIPIRFFAVTRCLEHRWPEVFDALTTSDEVAAAVETWTPNTYAKHAEGTGPAATVATQLLSDPELRLLLEGAHGREWLTDPVLRGASVSFLFTQQRLSQLDTSEVSVKYDAFVSYQADNRRDAIQIVDGLSQAGLRIFFDQHIRPGADWQETLDGALSSSGVVIYCVGPHTFESRGQMLEWDRVIDRSDVLIIPVLLAGADPSALPDLVQRRQWVDMRDGVSEEGVMQLVRALKYRRRRSSGRAIKDRLLA